ncbi:hypothetical protein DFH06DRAFT_156374 [Mycena polygramma]|nr:hypothetical protein DFH06DRAFT_156374 [Mycena polygramma]
MTLMSIDDRLALLRKTLKEGLPMTAGVHPVDAEDLVLYYDVENRSNRIDLRHASENDIAALSSACPQSDANHIGKTSGIMGAKKFSTRLDLAASGLLDVVATDVLQGDNADGNKSLKAQLKGLNVYGPGDSINNHSEIPQGNYMIGTLVVIFPIPHVGGRVLAQHGDAPFSLDPASELAAASTPAIWYMAFYGDVPHMVEPLASGHRVSLTYNLLLVDPSVPAAQPVTPTATERRLEDTLRALLADPAFLPAGGFLAAGLAHGYPMPRPPTDFYDLGVHYEGNVVIREVPSEQRWGPVLRALKGADARLRAVSNRIGLAPFVRLLYAPDSEYEDDCDVLVDDIPDLWGVNECAIEMFGGDEDMRSMRTIMAAGTVLQRGAERVEELQWMRVGRHPSAMRPMQVDQFATDEEEEEISPSQGPGAVAVHWLSRLGEQNRIRTAYISSDTMVEYQCGTAALFIRVPAAGQGVRSS